MKYGFILLTLLLIFQATAQKIITYNWGAAPCAERQKNERTVFPLNNWQLQTNGQSSTVQAPFVVADAGKISVGTHFTLNRKLRTSGNLYLISGGIKGSASIYLNGHLISFVSNAQQPFKILLPTEFLTDDSLQSIRLKIKQPENTHEGFPLIVYTYSESHVIGLFAPMCITMESKPVITGFQQQILPAENGFKLSYSYRVNINGDFSRLQLDEVFQRDTDGKAIFHKIRFAKDLSSKALLIHGEFPLNKQSVWNTDTPQTITLHIKLNLFGKTKRIVNQTFRFGARTFTWRKGQFYLNGQLIPIHGITWHQNLRRFNQKNYRQTLTSDLQSLKSLGINAVRFSHFLPDTQFLHLCDSLGFLVFAELPLWRFPKSFFQENYLLEMAKNTCLQMTPFYQQHPSLVAVGLGTEIPIEDPATQKFMFILKGKIKSLLPVLTYVSPIPGRSLPPEKVADFYLVDQYHPLNVLQDAEIFKSASLVGKIGVLTEDIFRKEQKEKEHEINRGLFLKEEIGKTLFQFKTAGGFIESFQDWFVPYPSLIIQNSQAPYIIPQGLFQVNGEPKTWTKLLDKPWAVEESAVIQTAPKNKRPTNFFSILVTLIVLLFFSLYRRLPRLRENMQRSLRHSYGFFVDMRERRIIPLLNSITVGIFFSLIVAAFISSQIYFYHNSYWMQEIMAVIFVPLGLFNYYLKISQSYWLLTLVLFLIFFLLPFIGAIGVKIFSVFSRVKIRFRQGIAVLFWSGAPLLWFFPISLISYHWVFYHQSAEIFWIILGLFFLWIHFRLVKGLHILFFAGSTTVFIVLLLCYSVPLLIFWALFNPPSYWFDYLKLLMNAQALF